jgi:uncharacterized protein (DUF433 family)
VIVRGALHDDHDHDPPELIGNQVLLPRTDLERLLELARHAAVVELQIHEEDVPTVALMRLAEQGGAFDFWHEEGENIYSDQAARSMPRETVELYSRKAPGESIMPTTTDRITKTPGICGGRACIRGHRIPVWVLVGYRDLGQSDAEILRGYPTLTPADLEAAWEYASISAEEIERDIRENEEGDPGFVE